MTGITKDVKSLIAYAEEQGWTVTQTTKRHHRFMGPDGEGPVIVSPNTNGRGFLNALSELTRAGLPDPRKVREETRAEIHLAASDVLSHVPAEEQPAHLGRLMHDLIAAMPGISPDIPSLAALMLRGVFEYAQFRDDYVPNRMESDLAEALDLVNTMESERDAALRERDAVERRLVSATEKYDAVVAQLSQAVAEREAAEAKSAELESVLAPLRALLAPS